MQQEPASMNPLRQIIQQEIVEHGPIPFSRYTQLCLYHPEHGYYARSAGQFGKAGDFYTSSDVHAVFGRLLARQFEEMWHLLGSPHHIEVVELGPGRALFAQDALDWSARMFPDFFQALRYVLVESSPALRLRIAVTLQDHLSSGKAVLESSLPEKPDSAALPTIIFANEFFDALPVEILSFKGSLRVVVNEGRLAETWGPASAEEFEFLDRHSVHPEGEERVEATLIAQEWMERIVTYVQHGFVVAVDYGYTRDELLAGRHRGTVKAIRRHSVAESPYDAPGDQDITADVNFSALAAAAQKCNMQTQRLLTQCQFLMGVGEGNHFADTFADCKLPQEHAKRALQLKQLVTPAGMGESFQVLVASKGIDPEKVAKLSGLSFGRNR